MNKMLRPRALVHRGHVEARGLLIDDRLIREEEARRRVIELWSPRTTVYHLDEGYLVLLPEAIPVRAEAAPGGALVLENERLFSAPLAEDELEQLSPAEGAIVVVRGGRALIVEVEAADRVDPAAWIDVAHFELAEPETLGELPPPVEVVAKAVLDMREELRTIPLALSNPARTIEELIQASTPRGEPTLLERIKASLARIAARWFAPARRSSEAQAPLVDVIAQGSASFFQRLRRRLQELAAQLTRINALGRLVSQQHANYLARMMEMFERGELNEALKHAIPLGDGKKLDQSRPALSLPAPRSGLHISAGGTGRGSSIFLDDELFIDLQRMYRRAFERLEREGRIEEAAFVLAELLQSTEEAVAFLEKHKRFELAAKLAESRGLPPGLIVRQWFLAGQFDRAVLLARRTGAFADALARLTRSNHKEAAEMLRVLWAQTLAAAGNYGAAVDTLWPVVDERHLAAPWVQAAIEAGGPLAARMLVRSLSLVAGGFTDVRDSAELFLANESFEGLATRSAFARALLSDAVTPETRVLARATVRTMVRDEARWNMSIEANELRSLVSLAGDGTLRTDLPARAPETAHVRLKDLQHPRTFRFRENDGGALRIADAVLLPSGRFLVALGEVGVRYLTADGRTIAHFDQPAEKLIVSDHGDRAITVASRGEVIHAGRIDLAHRRASAWCDLAICAYADSFDGSVWFIGEKNRYGGKDSLLGLDATTQKVEALWRLGDVSVKNIARSKHHLCSAIADDEGRLEIWTHDLPAMILRGRDPSPSSELDALLPDGTGAALREEHHALWLIHERTRREHVFPVPRAALLGMQLSAEFLAIAVRNKEGVLVLLLDPRTAKEHAELDLRGARACSVRLEENTLLLSDDRGRLIALDHRYGRILRILRLS